jgi:hypothetical protein
VPRPLAERRPHPAARPRSARAVRVRLRIGPGAVVFYESPLRDAPLAEHTEDTMADDSTTTTPAGPTSFDTHPSKYRHWKLEVSGDRATLAMAVELHGGFRPGYELKLNSYDLGVDIELCDAIQRMRFEHPEVRASSSSAQSSASSARARTSTCSGIVDPRLQGQLLQVHQRDPALDRGRVRRVGPEVPRRASTARPRAAATSSRSRATRSSSSTTATAP